MLVWNWIMKTTSIKHGEENAFSVYINHASSFHSLSSQHYRPLKSTAVGRFYSKADPAQSSNPRRNSSKIRWKLNIDSATKTVSSSRVECAPQESDDKPSLPSHPFTPSQPRDTQTLTSTTTVTTLLRPWRRKSWSQSLSSVDVLVEWSDSPEIQLMTMTEFVKWKKFKGQEKC